MSDTPSDLTLFVGRFHPLLVHLPIGFIVLLAVLELLALRPRWRHLAAASQTIAGLAVLASVFSAGCGWLLSRAGGYDETLLQRHMWTGFGVAAVMLVTWLLRRQERLAAYRLFLAGALGVLVIASHLGGSLTHGSDYLTRHAPEPLATWLGREPRPAASLQTGLAAGGEKSVHAAHVQPLLDKYCVSCHGPEKSKADLRLDTLQGLLKGGESGPALSAGQGASSLVVKRMRLPADDENRMPPEGKPRPSPQELALIQWWIDAGASPDKKASELDPPEALRSLLGAAGDKPAPPKAQTAAQPKPRAEAIGLADALADDLAIAISALSSEEPWLQANASLAATHFGDAQLEKLVVLGPNLHWLDAAGTAITDAGLSHLRSMPNLTRLHLERTAITDAGLEHLAGLGQLEYLNLFGTPISDAGLAHLKALPKLKQLYLWQTRVTPAAAAAYGEAAADQEQIQRWRQEIAALQAKLKTAGMLVETGTPLVVAVPTNALPLNAICPVSGKPADPSKTTVFDGKRVAFCCDQCKAAFEKDPKPHLARLNPAPPASQNPDKK